MLPRNNVDEKQLLSVAEKCYHWTLTLQFQESLPILGLK